jgi:hypothetical protein
MNRVRSDIKLVRRHVTLYRLQVGEYLILNLLKSLLYSVPVKSQCS